MFNSQEDNSRVILFKNLKDDKENYSLQYVMIIINFYFVAEINQLKNLKPLELT